MIQVKVYRKSDGKPYKGAKVWISFSGLLDGGVSKNSYTDSDGIAYIDSDGGRNGKLYVGNSMVKEGTISGQEVVWA